MGTLTVEDIEIQLIKKNIKNLHLSVLPPDGSVRISAPKELNDETQAFADLN